MKNLSRGRVLMTKITKQWPEVKINRTNELERSMLFTDFSQLDEGRQRGLVCTMNRMHPDYEAYTNLFVLAPEMLVMLERIQNGELEDLRGRLIEIISFFDKHIAERTHNEQKDRIQRENRWELF